MQCLAGHRDFPTSDEVGDEITAGKLTKLERHMAMFHWKNVSET